MTVRDGARVGGLFWIVYTRLVSLIIFLCGSDFLLKMVFLPANPPFPHTPTSSNSLPPNALPLPPSAGLPPPPSSHGNPNANSNPGAPEPMVVDLSVDPHSVPPEFKKEGPDWFAIFNQNAAAGKDAGPSGKKRSLDVGLVHTLMHERCAVSMLYLESQKY